MIVGFFSAWERCPACFIRLTSADSGSKLETQQGGALKPACFVEAAWVGQVARDYAGGPPSDAPYSILPVVVRTYGAWHPDFVRWVLALHRGRADASAAGVAVANGLLRGMVWRVGAPLPVAAQRAVFRGLAAQCVPDLCWAANLQRSA